MKNTLLTISLLVTMLLLAQRFVHSTDSWQSHKLTKDLVSITCTPDKTPELVESATDQTIIVQCDKITEAQDK